MSRRYLPVLLVLSSAAVAILWIVTHTHWEEVEIPAPLRAEAATHPFYGAQRLAEALGARTRWAQDLPVMPPANAVIVAGAWYWNLVPGRAEQLERWVEAGGRLVTDQSLIGGEEELERWAGVTHAALRSAPRKPAPRNTTGRTVVLPAPITLPGVGVCNGLTVENGRHGAPETRDHYQVCGFRSWNRLTTTRNFTWGLRDESGGIQAMRIPIGLGSITLINSTPFATRELLAGDDALLFASATQLHRGDEVWFLVQAGGSGLLSLLWRHGAPVIVLGLTLLACWLWRSALRFGPLVAVPDRARRSLSEQIRGTGQFAARFGGEKALHAAAVRALTEAATHHIARYGNLPHEERVSALAHAVGLDATEVAAALTDTRSSSLHNTLARLEYARRVLLGQPEPR